MTRHLKRNRRKGILGGVAAGLGDYFDVDPVLVRLGFALLTFATGLGILFYVVCWVVMPSDERPGVTATEPGQPRAPSETVAAEVRAAGEKVVTQVRHATEAGRARLIGGAALICVGLVLLADRCTWMVRWPDWLRFANVWPLILIAVGVVLVLRSRENGA